MKLFKVSVVLFILMSCDGKTKTKEKVEDSSKQKKKEISAKAIERLKYNDYVLSLDADKALRDWSLYQELSTQTSYLKSADITFFTEQIDTLRVFLDSLKATVPAVINTEPVNARLSALETKLLKLNNDLVLDNYSTENKLTSIKGYLIANSNLIFVINKKIEFDKNDVGRPEGE